jgi:hypothetical protein
MDDKGCLKISPPGRGGPWVGVRSPPKSAEIAHETGTNQPVFVCEIFGLGSHHRGVSSLEMALPGAFSGGRIFPAFYEAEILKKLPCCSLN